jgi:hypothetical protein
MAQALTQTQVKGHQVIESSVVESMADTATVYTPTLPCDLSGQKIVAGVNNTVGGTNVVTDLSVQGSHNNSDWVQIGADVIADTTPDVTGVVLGTLDLSDYRMPYWRLAWNSVGNDADTTGRFKFILVTALS